MITKKRVLAMILAILLLFAACVVVDDVTVDLNTYEYYDSDLPMLFYGYRIMCISDFHNSFYPGQISKIINEEQPDVVLFLGDMTTLPKNNTDKFKELLDGITIDVPIYGVLGNHEEFSERKEELIQEFAGTKMQLLQNESVMLERDGASIKLVGVSDVDMEDDQIKDSYSLSQTREYLSEELDHSAFTILACHRANLYPYLSDLDADLMLSGHMHGGVVRVPFFGGVFGIDGGLMPDYDAGLYQETDMALYVSRGCDFLLTKPRINNGPEIVQIVLKK